MFLINPDGTTTEITTEGSIKDLLKTEECYVLVADDLRKVFLWKGLKSSVRSKFIGFKRSQEIRAQVGMHYAVVPVDEGEEGADFINLIGGQTQAGIEKSTPKTLELGAGMSMATSQENKFLYRESLASTNLFEELQEKLKRQNLTINKLKQQIEDRQRIATSTSEEQLSNKDRILNLLKLQNLTSKQIAVKLNLSKQDTRTYLLRLRKENKIKTVGKKGRYYVYTSRIPIDTDSKSYKDEISQKISELEAKVNNLATKPIISHEEAEFFELEKELLYRASDKEKPIFQAPSNQFLESTFIQPDGTIQSLLAAIPEIKAAAIVTTEGLPIATVLPQGVSETRISSIMANLYLLAEKAIKEVKKGEFDQLYVKGSDGYLLVLPAGPNAVLSVSTSKDVRLGLIFLDCKRTCEKIAKLI